MLRQELLATLTPLERRAAELLCQGKATKAIAYELGSTPNSITVMFSHIFQKLGAKNRVHLALILVGAMPPTSLVPPGTKAGAP